MSDKPMSKQNEDLAAIVNEALMFIAGKLSGADANTGVQAAAAIIVQLTMSLNEALGVEGQERQTQGFVDIWKGQAPFLGLVSDKPLIERGSA